MGAFASVRLFVKEPREVVEDRTSAFDANGNSYRARDRSLIQKRIVNWEPSKLPKPVVVVEPSAFQSESRFEKNPENNVVLFSRVSNLDTGQHGRFGFER